MNAEHAASLRPKHNPSIRLVAVDMDGTLLDARGAIPDDFWTLAAEARSRGMVIAPASGRQLATLRSLFQRDTPTAFIAENGSVVSIDGQIAFTTPMDEDDVRAVVAATSGLDASVVVCQPETAFILRNHDEATRTEIDKYYYSVEEIDDLSEAVSGNVVKIAFFGEAEEVVAPTLRAAVPHLGIAVSGAQWVDVMNPEANKGRALEALARTLDMTIDDTAAFGDYLNDYELIHTAGTGYAMANAHPDLKAIADRIAPANTEGGVLTELRSLIDAAV